MNASHGLDHHLRVQEDLLVLFRVRQWWPNQFFEYVHWRVLVAVSFEIAQKVVMPLAQDFKACDLRRQLELDWHASFPRSDWLQHLRLLQEGDDASNLGLGDALCLRDIPSLLGEDHRVDQLPVRLRHRVRLGKRHIYVSENLD